MNLLSSIDTKELPVAALDHDELWYKDAIIYQLHVKAFADSNNDGIGDFAGLTEKLDYLQELGVTALWLLPFYPSPGRDDGYDISDYRRINPDFGTMQHFRRFLQEAHRRNLRVITELVINHTSDQHPWFKRARRKRADSDARNWYVWSDNDQRYSGTRIIFSDTEKSNWTWDPEAKAYYWHRFFSHQPDLNFDNPRVILAMVQVMRRWLDFGVDGFRLDAIPYLCEREGTNNENLPETHAVIKRIRAELDAYAPGKVLLAEANQWPEDVSAYFGEGDECHMAYHFPLMPRIYMAIAQEDRFPITDILRQTPDIPANCQWALFLRNHDELTLEMVTDVERDYLWSTYANDPRARINVGIRRRLAPLMDNDRRKIELMNSLLFSFPGTPIIYYGDEIGMGDNIYLGDRNGVRTPMQWSADRNAGFSRANPQRLYLPIIIDPEHHYEAINVEAQQQNLSSPLWWMKRLILLRKRFNAFSRGTTEFRFPENRKVLVFIRRLQDEIILTVANLSRFVQCVEIDLSQFKGAVPVELFGQTEFPPIGDLPYFVTLGPHSFYWFKVETAPAAAARSTEEAPVASLEVTGDWEQILKGSGKSALEKILPAYLKNCRWFGGKARRIRSVGLSESVAVPLDSDGALFTVVEVSYREGEPDYYFLPLTFIVGDRVTELTQSSPQPVVARLKVRRNGGIAEGVLLDALSDRIFLKALLEAIFRRRTFQGKSSEISALPSKLFRKLSGAEKDLPEPIPAKREQSNTSVVYGDRFILKMFRRLQEGVNPELEIGSFITERTSFEHVPKLAGSFRWSRGSRSATLGVLQSWIRNEGEAWSYTLDHLGDFLEHCSTVGETPASFSRPARHLLDFVDHEMPLGPRELVGSYLASARLLGQRTGELHVALASDGNDPDFAPEPFTPFYRRSVYQSMRTAADRTLTLLRERSKNLPDEIRGEAEKILPLRSEIFGRYRFVVDQKISA